MERIRLSGVVCGLEWRTEEVGEGRHVDFVVYAGVWSGCLSECGSRDDGARGAAAPAPVNIETWRDLSSGRPRAARILLAPESAWRTPHIVTCSGRGAARRFSAAVGPPVRDGPQIKTIPGAAHQRDPRGRAGTAVRCCAAPSTGSNAGLCNLADPNGVRGRLPSLRGRRDCRFAQIIVS